VKENVVEFLKKINVPPEEINDLLKIWLDGAPKEINVLQGMRKSDTAEVDIYTKEITAYTSFIEAVKDDMVGVLAHEQAHLLYQCANEEQLALALLTYEILGNEYDGLFSDLLVDTWIGSSFPESLKKRREHAFKYQIELANMVTNRSKALPCLVAYYGALYLGEYDSPLLETTPEDVDEIIKTLATLDWDLSPEDPGVLDLACSFKNLMKRMGVQNTYRNLLGAAKPDIDKLNKETKKKVLGQLGKLMKNRSGNKAVEDAISSLLGKLAKSLAGSSGSYSPHDMSRHIESYKALAEGLKIDIPEEKVWEQYHKKIGLEEICLGNCNDDDLSAALEQPEDYREGNTFYKKPVEIEMSITDPAGKKKKTPVAIIIDSSGSMQDPAGIENGNPSLAVLAAYTILKSFPDSPVMVTNFGDATVTVEDQKPTDALYRQTIKYQKGGTVLKSAQLKTALEKFSQQYGKPLVFMLTDLEISNQTEVERFFDKIGEYASGGLILHIGGEGEGKYGELSRMSINSDKDILKITIGTLEGYSQKDKQSGIYLGGGFK